MWKEISLDQYPIKHKEGTSVYENSGFFLVKKFINISKLTPVWYLFDEEEYLLGTKFGGVDPAPLDWANSLIKLYAKRQKLAEKGPKT